MNYEEQTVELEKLRIKETELLQFNKELSERTVKLQNEISLFNSKVCSSSSSSVSSSVVILIQIF